MYSAETGRSLKGSFFLHKPGLRFEETPHPIPDETRPIKLGLTVQRERVPGPRRQPSVLHTAGETYLETRTG